MDGVHLLMKLVCTSRHLQILYKAPKIPVYNVFLNTLFTLPKARYNMPTLYGLPRIVGRRPGTAEPFTSPQAMSKSPTISSSDPEEYELQTMDGSEKLRDHCPSESDIEQRREQIAQRLNQLEEEKKDLLNIDDEQENQNIEEACLQQSRAYRKLKAEVTPANQEEYNRAVVRWRQAMKSQDRKRLGLKRVNDEIRELEKERIALKGA